MYLHQKDLSSHQVNSQITNVCAGSQTFVLKPLYNLFLCQGQIIITTN